MEVFSTLLPDIIRTHILTRLDGPTLAATACTSSSLRALTIEEDKLWQQICSSMWVSSNNPRISQIINSFPSGHRSFFADSFPVLDHPTSCHYNLDRLPVLSELISAVDISYEGKSIFSSIRETETRTGKFLCSPFRIELLGPKEKLIDPTRYEINSLLQHMKESLRLSWILIDPVGKRAGNMSSRTAVSIQWPSPDGELQLRYSTIMGGFDEEKVECRLVVTCSGVDEGEVQIDEVSMEMKDMNGRNLDGRESLVIIKNAIEKGERRKHRKVKEVKKYEEFVKGKEGRKKLKKKEDGVVYMVCVGVMTCIALWISFFLLIVLYFRSITTKLYCKIRR